MPKTKPLRAPKNNIDIDHSIRNSGSRRRRHKKKRSNSPNVEINELWTGTSKNHIQRAAATYLNNVGPGQYDLPPLFGTKTIETRKRNLPLISFRMKTKPVLHKEFAKELLGRHSPPPIYSPNHEMSSLKLSPSSVSIGKAEKFFEPLQLSYNKYIKDNLPHYYSSISPNQVSPSISQIEHDKNSGKISPDYLNCTRLWLAQSYRAPTFRGSKRSDFTKVPQQDFANVSFYDPLKSISFAKEASKNVKIKKDVSTFGTSFKDQEKVYQRHLKQHYYGRGPSCDLGNSLDLTKQRQHLLREIFSPMRNPELVAEYRKQPGPGAYDPMKSLDLLENSNVVQPRAKNFNTFGKQDREVIFAKYASLNAPIYTKGLI